FHAPLSEMRKWEGFHSHWASSLTAQLNAGLLPPHHFAEPQVSHGRIEVDVATNRLPGDGTASGQPTPSSRPLPTLAPPACARPRPLAGGWTAYSPPVSQCLSSTLRRARRLWGPSSSSAPATRHAPPRAGPSP